MLAVVLSGGGSRGAYEAGALAYAARRVGDVQNDEECDWSAAWAHFPGNVVYVWHAGVHAAEVQATLPLSQTMGEHVDVDVSGLLRKEMTMDQAGDALLDMMLRTASGRYTAAEALGHREFVLTKLYESA